MTRHRAETYDADTETAGGEVPPQRFSAEVLDDTEAREKFGGVNAGAIFFGWLVAMGMAILLVSIVGAVVAAVGSAEEITQSEAEREAGTIGLSAGIVLVAVMMLAYYAGGYVAGRMSRFDGGKQGLGVWAFGLIVTLATLILGVVFGAEYNVLDRVELPRMPIPTDTLTWGGVITAIAVLVGTLAAAMLGGKLGSHYHRRVDKRTLVRR